MNDVKGLEFRKHIIKVLIKNLIDIRRKFLIKANDLPENNLKVSTLE